MQMGIKAGTPAGLASYIANDTFTRTAGNWGSASPTGGLWTAASATAAATDGAKATVGPSTIQTQGKMELRASARAKDVKVKARFIIPTITGVQSGLYGLLARGGTAGGVGTDFLGCYFVQDAANAVSLSFRGIIGNSSYADISASLGTLTPGDSWWMEYLLRGKTNYVRAWKDGTTPPGPWTLKAESLAFGDIDAVGYCGYAFFMPTGGTLFTFNTDDFSVVAI